MSTRLALILILVVQQFSLPAVLALWMPADCDMMSCCRVVETTTCCGERTVEIQCGKSGGACVCDQEPGRSETPVPAVPTADSTGPAVAILPCEVTVAGERSHGSRVTGPGTTGPPIRSHNTRQAFLGTWRT